MSSSSTTSLSWLSRLVLGEKVREGEVAKRDFQEALSEHRFDAEQMREQLDQILAEAEHKAQALSIRPAPKTKQERDGSEHEPGNRTPKAGTG